MTRDDDFIGQLEGYIEEYEGMTPLPDAVRHAIRAELPTTRQIAPSSGLMRTVLMVTPTRFAIAAAAAVIVIVVGINLLYGSGGVGGQTVSPSPSATPRPSPFPTPPEVNPGSGDLTIGRHSLTVDGVPFSFSVPASGWEPSGSLLISKSAFGSQGAEAVIFWTSFPDGVYADPCGSLLSLPVGASAADVAAAVSTVPGTELVTGPSDISVGGYPATHVVLTLREDVGCNPGFFYTWPAPAGGAFWETTAVGDTIRVWIVDVGGTLLFIEGDTTSYSGPDVREEIQQIVDSIQFD